MQEEKIRSEKNEWGKTDGSFPRFLDKANMSSTDTTTTVLLLLLYLTPLLLLLPIYLLLRPAPPPFPLANTFPNDPFRKKAHAYLATSARSLITTSLAKFSASPFAISIPHNTKILLPASLADFVKASRTLDHRTLVKEDFLASIPGFEAQAVLHADDDTVLKMIRTKLGQSESTVGVINRAVAESVRERFGEETEWKEIGWMADTMEVIARAASAVFVGPEKGSDREWLEVVKGYVLAYFTAVGELNGWPRWARGYVHWWLPSARACRAGVVRARQMAREVLEGRAEQVRRAEREGRETPVWNDALAWGESASGGTLEAGDVQLSLAMAALFTTTEQFRATLVEVARREGLVEELRAEAEREMGASGVSVAAAGRMVLMDSVLKEAQRMSAAVGESRRGASKPWLSFSRDAANRCRTVALERAATENTRLPDGSVIPRGAHIMVDSTTLWDPALYPNPDTFDGHRFLRKREEGDKSSQFVQSSPGYHVFGGGRHICPGRFFAANELKIALAHVLLKYDVRLKGCDPKTLYSGFYGMVDPAVRFEVRRRKGGAVLDG